jgi:hypothetical protein
MNDLDALDMLTGNRNSLRVHYAEKNGAKSDELFSDINEAMEFLSFVSAEETVSVAYLWDETSRSLVKGKAAPLK